MTRQEAFNKVWDWFVTQSHPPCVVQLRDGTTKCLYRSPSGNRCAIGVLIPDDKYDPSIDEVDGGMSVVGLLTANEDIFNSIGLEIEFLKNLQSTHDCLAIDNWGGRNMKQALEGFAKAYNLEVPVTA